MSVGATKLSPEPRTPPRGACQTRRPRDCIAWTWRSIDSRASESITGPMSTASDCGSPICSSSTAPRNISSRRSAASSCTHSRRSAEQRWPALSKADDTMPATACSIRAEESTSIAFWPPVSAISGTTWPRVVRRRLSERCSSRATSVEPVNTTPFTRGSSTNAAPTLSPRPGSNCSAPAGTPALSKARTATAATSGVCSAGLTSTTLLAANAAAT